MSVKIAPFLVSFALGPVLRFKVLYRSYSISDRCHAGTLGLDLVHKKPTGPRNLKETIESNFKTQT